MRIGLSPAGPVSLRAQWTVVNEETKSLVMAREANISEPAGGRDFAGMVAALSRALATLSRDIAGAIGDQHTDKSRWRPTELDNTFPSFNINNNF